MKIKNLAITILMTTFLIILGTKVYATTGTINEETVKLRKAPDSKTVLDLLDEGDEVEILEQVDGWYKVKATTELGKVTGYISEELVDVEEDIEASNEVQENVNTTNTEETPVEEPVTDETVSTDVTVENTNTVQNIEEDNKYSLGKEVSVKALPLINSKEKAKISGEIVVIEIINEWARVENDTDSGWIRKNNLKGALTVTEVTEQETEVQPEEQPTQTEQEEEPSTEESQETETTEINKTGYVSTEGLRVRKEPSTDSEAIDSLSKNDEVKIIGQTGNWYKIDLDGEIGYVSAKYISDTKIAETTSRSGSTLKNETTTTEQEKTEKEETQADTTTPSTPTTSATTGAQVVEFAKKYLKYKYVSGGASPETGFDCSGFTSYVYKQFGISLYRTSKDQIKNGVAVEKSDLQPGDLVIFNNDANTAIGHVGIYVGNGNFIHASNPSDGVKITTLTSGYYHIRYVGARRVI